MTAIYHEIYGEIMKTLCSYITKITLVLAFCSGPLFAQSYPSGRPPFPFTPSGPTPIVVQTAVNTAAMNSGTGTVAITPTAGNVVIVEMEEITGGHTVSVADNLGHSLTEASCSPQSPATGSPSGYYYHQFSYTVPSGGPTSLNFTFTGSYGQAVVFEVSGLASAAAQACSADAYVNTNVNPLPSATPTTSPSLAIGVFNINGPGTPAPGSGWTYANTVSTSGTQFWVEYKSQTGTAAITAPIGGLTAAPGPNALINIW